MIKATPKVKSGTAKSALGPSKARGEKNLALMNCLPEELGNSSTKVARAYAKELDAPDAIPKRERKGDFIIFNEDDLINVVYPYKDALVILAAITDFNVTRIMIDTRSATYILYYHIFLKMDFIDEMLELAIYSLIGFTSDFVHTKGGIRLPLMISLKPA
ncbi:hypothetical protein NE237_010710 [Protea cynaroides]|uniref:Uncharacterized protein n=1 Tax=Protea cynaroides TaxID=273540 RepID=A0A9Q0R1H2_9MAGN|nr:hypothetical protein NE237_010710 [Protea cynaroides]